MVHNAVLLVDDDEGLLRLNQLALKHRTDYDVRIASSGEAALDRIETISPVLVILDMMMPGMNGIEVCRYLRARSAFRTTPIVMLTASSDPADHELALAAGATAIWKNR